MRRRRTEAGGAVASPAEVVVVEAAVTDVIITGKEEEVEVAIRKGERVTMMPVPPRGRKDPMSNTTNLPVPAEAGRMAAMPTTSKKDKSIMLNKPPPVAVAEEGVEREAAKSSSNSSKTTSRILLAKLAISPSAPPALGRIPEVEAVVARERRRNLSKPIMYQRQSPGEATSRQRLSLMPKEASNRQIRSTMQPRVTGRRILIKVGRSSSNRKFKAAPRERK